MAKTALDSKTGLVIEALSRQLVATTDACHRLVRQASDRHPTTNPQTSDGIRACHVYGDLHAIITPVLVLLVLLLLILVYQL